MTSLVREVSVSVDMDTGSVMPIETAFVFGWNNLLCPTSWLRRSNFASSAHTPESQVMFALLDQLDLQIAEVIAHALSLGAVYIVCDDQEQAILELCAAYFRRAKELLFHHPGVLVVYADTPPNDAWYVKSWDISVAVFGTEALRAAARAVGPAAPSVVLKTMAFARAQPTILECSDRLRKLKASFDEVAFLKTAADIAF
ncbi:hypothetical protein SDRG_14037 [Saprolegnia diclina VS20]|uniref:Uncharacterized protein n=1 Tax=Saprolegnia diclina (strain VS20) TaxID=1156394 RepID=T0R7Z9_SAPDV|nr:hypothetical protein SDRG_14037 [Saprolegnia diclina VS20]EQC28213.1 hypothetical protein SDRG_14037 [Saprolegnia diclina VS20]|eukprot:XP_008618362.1 hypothetical protein SDRG_14037 [Saprolegnia diclina VS20]